MRTEYCTVLYCTGDVVSVGAGVPAARLPQAPGQVEEPGLRAEPPHRLQQHQLQLPQVRDPAGAGESAQPVSSRVRKMMKKIEFLAKVACANEKLGTLCFGTNFN